MKSSAHVVAGNAGDVDVIRSIYLVKELGDEVVLAAIDYKWLEDYLNSHPGEIPSSAFGSRRMLTASTEQLGGSSSRTRTVLSTILS